MLIVITPDFAIAVSVRQPRKGYRTENRTFQLSGNQTLQLSAYTLITHNLSYVKSDGYVWLRRTWLLESSNVKLSGELKVKASGNRKHGTSAFPGGEFEGLINDDSNDTPVIAAKRPGGAIVSVEAMSEGARDQLYLALVYPL